MNVRRYSENLRNGIRARYYDIICTEDFAGKLQSELYTIACPDFVIMSTSISFFTMSPQGNNAASRESYQKYSEFFLFFISLSLLQIRACIAPLDVARQE